MPKEITAQEYLLRQMQLLLQGDVVIESACENYSWPTNERGPVQTAPAGRYEFYICARLPTTPDGLTPAPLLPLEALLRQHAPELFE